MHNFIRQLRQREVFRTAGLYVGVCWILIQAADVLFPAFDVADWILQSLIYVAAFGFPIILVLAWFFDISEEGIALDDSRSDVVTPRFGERKIDFVIIGLLAVALAFSLFLEFADEPESEKFDQSAAIVIARFDNRTDDAHLDGLIEARLAMLVEQSPRVFAIEQRRIGKRVTGHVYLIGEIERDGRSIRLTVRGLGPDDQTVLFEETVKVSRPADWLRVIDTLGRSVLADMDIATVADSELAAWPFTSSFAAAKAWSRARELESMGETQDAVAFYQQAVNADPAFGPAHAGLALLQYQLGRDDAANASWNRALAHQDSFTERERLKILGIYQLEVAGDASTALSYFSELLEKYPAETAVRSYVARAAFQQANFATALAESTRVLEVFADDWSEHLRAARYARYAGDVERSIAIAELLLQNDAQRDAALLQLALARSAYGQLDAARLAYSEIADHGPLLCSRRWVSRTSTCTWVNSNGHAQRS